MSTSFKNGFYGGALAAAFLGLWLLRLWQPEKQVRLHTAHFLQAIEARNWSSIGDFVSANYQDQWGDDRRRLLERLRLVLSQFSSLGIVAEGEQVTARGSAGWWSARVHLHGAGEDQAREITAHINRLSEPFALHWQRESWRPWDWKLVRASNPALSVPADF